MPGGWIPVTAIRMPLILFLCLMGTVSPASAETVHSPDWSLLSADGKSLRLSEEVQSQPVVLFFWATWCPYCKALMPHLQSIRLEYGDHAKILAVHFRDDNDPVAFINDAGYDFTVLMKGEDVAALYDVWATPGVLIVDTDMLVRFDLRKLPPQEPLSSEEAPSHRKKAAYRAPYWAAEIRKALDAVLANAP